jgi:uncharacterized protein with FMN-binding domain
MRRITLAVMSTISGLVLLFSYHTSTSSTAGTAPATGGAGTGESPAGGSSGTDDGSSSGSDASSGGETFTGDEAQTRWGPVQVKITVSDGRITSAEAVEYPTGNHRDQEINAYAVPQLNAEVVAAQSADVDAVSGATVTSDGYVESLQSAIDQAHL